MALSHGLTSRQTLILCCSLLLTIAGCGLLWHVHRNDADILEIIPVPVAPGVSITGTMGVGKRAYDYYIFGYLLLWVSHLAAAKVHPAGSFNLYGSPAPVRLFQLGCCGRARVELQWQRSNC